MTTDLKPFTPVGLDIVTGSSMRDIMRALDGFHDGIAVRWGLQDAASPGDTITRINALVRARSRTNNPYYDKLEVKFLPSDDIRSEAGPGAAELEQRYYSVEYHPRNGTGFVIGLAPLTDYELKVARERLYCGQCGQLLAMEPCGPTHAMLYLDPTQHIRFLGL